MAEEAEKKTITLTEGETKLFISIMKNLESDIAFNADAVAAECGYKTGKIVKDRWGQIKRGKLGINAAATPKKTATPAKKRKGSEGGEATQGEEGFGSPTPTKKARKPKAKSEPKVKEEEMEDAGEDVGGEDFGADGEE